MAVVSPVPFALALVGAVALFGAWLPSAIAQSRAPVRWRDPPLPPAITDRRSSDALTTSALATSASGSGPRAAGARPALTPVPTPAEPPPPPRKPFRLPPVRVAVVISVFVVWSVWATGRRPRPDSRLLPPGPQH